MDKLEEALKEALSRNADETVRWTKYKEEQETAIRNFRQFSERIAIEVMVPIGPKAFMPGQLYHTNEILVSHYQGIFSKCSSHQAQQIANRRIDMAKQRLDNLEKERKMYQNKLDVPHLDGALPTGDEREIIEEFIEEEENKWRIEHRRRVREAKLKESKAIAEVKEDKSNENVIKLLDELELMEELEDELEKLQVEDDETLQKLMAGEIPLPQEKKRISHYCEKGNNIVVGDQIKANENLSNKRPSNDVDEMAQKLKIIKINDSRKVDYTNNNSVANLVDYRSDDSDSPSEDGIPERVLRIESEAKHLPISEKIKHFKRNIREVEKELKEIKVKSVEDLNEKMNRLDVREYLADYIDLLEDELNSEPTENEFDMVEVKGESSVEKANLAKKKKRISFANKDEVQFIDKNQAPNVVMRSKIELNDESYEALKLKPPSGLSSSTTVKLDSQLVDRKKDIAEKVQKNYEFVIENQSQQDFNLIDKIINSAESEPYTLHIPIIHLDNCNLPMLKKETSDDEVIASPADIYEVFKKYFPHSEQTPGSELALRSAYIEINCNRNAKETAAEGNKEYPHAVERTLNSTQEVVDAQKSVNETTILKEINQKAATSIAAKKSILKNKEKVKLEDIVQMPSSEVKTRTFKATSRKETEGLSGFDLVMGDVMQNENPMEFKEDAPKTEPDPLPNENFVDVSTPKKRISRFKQMRTNT